MEGFEIRGEGHVAIRRVDFAQALGEVGGALGERELEVAADACVSRCKRDGVEIRQALLKIARSVVDELEEQKRAAAARLAARAAEGVE